MPESSSAQRQRHAEGIARSDSKIPVAVLGGSGYVAGELLRLLAGHPRLEVAAIASTSQVGESVVASFPHLAGALPDGLRFVSPAGIVEPLERIREQALKTPDDLRRGRLETGPGLTNLRESFDTPAFGKAGVFAATPHGATAALVDETLFAAERADMPVHVVDLSADFRFRDPERFAAIYGKPHGAPARCASFTCSVPEHTSGAPTRHAAQPGCFTTSVVLPAAPLVARGLVEGEIFVSAVTGSSGSGRTPSATTHHPARRSTVYAYSPLGHRHEAEMRALLGVVAGGPEPDLAFVPHSGPFVRGIHSTLHVRLVRAVAAQELVEEINADYAAAPFVSATVDQPKLTDVIGTNRCRIGVTVRDRTAVLTSVIDNLVKGAAGGGIQWMNRLFGLPDDTGLRVPGLGWF